MTIDEQKLRDLATKAAPLIDSDHSLHDDEMSLVFDYRRATKPAVVLALLAEVERLRRVAREALAVADGLVYLTAPGLDTFRDAAVTDLAAIRKELSHE